MHDPYFDATCADIRGFDLGDDAPLLALVDDVTDLTSDERLFRGVLRARAGRNADAIADFDAVVDAGHARSLALYLSAHCRASAEDLEDARKRLTRAETAARADHLVPPADLAHARGRLAWLAGDVAEAIASVRLGLDSNDGNALRWVDAATLHVGTGNYDRALECVEQALALESDLVDAHYEAAVIATLAAPHGSAATKWRAAFALDPALRRRASADPRLADARDMPALAAVIGPPPAPDVRWIDDAPKWLQDLRDALPLRERGIAWLDEDARRRHAAEVCTAYETGLTGTMMTEATLAHARNRLTTMVPVARLPIRPTRDGQPDFAELWIDEAEPDRLWLAWSAYMPPFLWIDVGTSAERIAACVDPLSTGRPTRRELPRIHRVFLGYTGGLVVPHPVTGELETAGMLGLEQYLSLSPYLESGAWGAAFDDDPWPDVIPDQPDRDAKIETRQQACAAQSDAHVWSMTRRLRHSRAYVTLELHHDDLVVLEIRYAPNPHPDVIEGLNAAFEADYPTDLPLDALAATLGLVFDSAPLLQPKLRELDEAGDHEQLAGLLYVLSALRHGELDAHDVWRAHAGHEVALVRETIVNIAVAYNFESLLEERTLLEPDEELRAEIERMLDAGLAPPHWDPYDPIGIEDPFDDDLEDEP